jgi:hypothetical protein
MLGIENIMDREQLFDWVKHWYPIVVAILSSLLDFFAFMIGLQWAANSILFVGIFSLVATMLMSAILIFILYKVSTSSYIQEFTHLESKDKYIILTPDEVVHKRIVRVKVNRPASHFVTYPASVDGVQTEFKAYQLDDPSVEYKVSIQRIGGRRALFVNLGRYLKKNEIIDNLCIECRILDSFNEEHEGVSVGADPGQKHCSIHISFPDNCPPISKKADWFVFYGRNQVPLSDGWVEANQSENKTHQIEYNFSNHLSEGIGVQCAISWRWKPNL